MAEPAPPLMTPDGRYVVVRGRLWRASNPSLSADERQRLVDELMDARRAVKESRDNGNALMEARSKVNQAKVGLGERGQVWWNDGSPDLNKHLAKNTPYAGWYRSVRDQGE